MQNWMYLLWNFNVQISIYFGIYGFFFLIGGESFGNYYYESGGIGNERLQSLFYLFNSLNSYEMAYAKRKEMLGCNAMGNCVLWSLSLFLNVYFLKEFTLFFKILNLACNIYFLIFTYYILCVLKMSEIKLPA